MSQGFLSYGYKGGCNFEASTCTDWIAANPGVDYFCMPLTDEQQNAREQAYADTRQAVGISGSRDAARIAGYLEQNVCNLQRTALGICLIEELSLGEDCPVLSNYYGCSDPLFDTVVEAFDTSSVPNCAASPNDVVFRIKYHVIA